MIKELYGSNTAYPLSNDKHLRGLSEIGQVFPALSSLRINGVAFFNMNSEKSYL
jgi:hypothetical protein